MKKLYQVNLAAAQRQQLQTLLRTGQATTHVITRSRVLLNAAAGWNDRKIAEAFEIGVVIRQYLRRRLGQLEFVVSEVAAWELECNQKKTKTKVKWQFDCAKARVTLLKFYPKIEPP